MKIKNFSLIILQTLCLLPFAASCTGDNDDVEYSIEVRPEYLELVAGETRKVEAFVTPENCREDIRWKSSDMNIAKVSVDGTVTAVSAGNADITAICGDKSATCKVNVSSGTEIEEIIMPESLSVTRGQDIAIEIRLLPLDADKTALRFTSSDESIATVSEEGIVSGLAVGEATITASSGSISEECRVTVSPVTVSEITLNETTLNLEKGEKFQLTATISPDDADSRTITWSSSDEYIATVTQDGLVKAEAVGTATITAECSGAETYCTINVSGRPNVGDWYYSDGTWSYKMNPAKEPIGIIFWTGDPGKDDKYLKDEHPGCINGLAVSLEDYNDYAMWQEPYAWKEHKEVIGKWIEENTEYPSVQVGTSQDERVSQLLGYGFTKALSCYDADESHSNYRIEMIRALEIINEETPAPESSSGWFIPSSKELDLVCNGEPDGKPDWQPLTNKKLLNARLSEAGFRTFNSYLYWSCMEIDEDNAVVFAFDHGVPMYDLKPSGRQLCFVLAF